MPKINKKDRRFLIQDKGVVQKLEMTNKLSLHFGQGTSSKFCPRDPDLFVTPNATGAIVGTSKILRAGQGDKKMSELNIFS